MNDSLIQFYRGTGTDNVGRMLAQIIGFTDVEFEGCHNHVQWLFPLRERSMFNPVAPLLDDETVFLFRTDAELRKVVREVFTRAVRFLGFDWQDGDLVGNPVRISEWARPNNHNILRITRILRFLNTIDMRRHAEALFEALHVYVPSDFSRKGGVSAWYFWQDAMYSMFMANIEYTNSSMEPGTGRATQIIFRADNPQHAEDEAQRWWDGCHQSLPNHFETLSCIKVYPFGVHRLTVSGVAVPNTSMPTYEWTCDRGVCHTSKRG